MAGTIKLFQYLQNCYQLIGIHPPKLNQRSGSFNLKNSTLIFLLLQLGIASISFFIFKAKSAYDYGFSFFMSISALSMLVYYPNIILKMPDILKLIENYEQYIEKRMHDSDSTAKYTQFGGHLELGSEILFFIVGRVSLVASVVPHLLITILNYFIYNLGNESYTLPFPVMLPFNWKTPFGYCAAYLIVSSAAFSLIYCHYLVFCFLIGSSWLSITIVEDITNDLKDMKISKITHETQDKLKRRIINAVKFHSDAKQLVEEYNEINQYITTGYFLWTVLSIASSLLGVQMQLTEHIIGIDFINTLVVVFWSFATICLFCGSGEMITQKFNVFHDELCMCDWYTFPLELQRMVIIFMANTQNSATLRGFANTICTHEAVKQTVNGGFSYFMMLRQIKA